MNPPDYPMVIVAWHDAHAETTWCRLDEIDPDPYVVHTVGWLLPESTKPGHMSVMQSFSPDCVDHIIHIPHSWLIERRTIVEEPQ